MFSACGMQGDLYLPDKGTENNTEKPAQQEN
jgi:predicted small lipoprotein YifL